MRWQTGGRLCTLNDRELSQGPEIFLRRKSVPLGLVFQDFALVSPYERSSTIVRFGLKPRWSRAEAEKEALILRSDRVGLERYGILSARCPVGGEQQRVALAGRWRRGPPCS